MLLRRHLQAIAALPFVVTVVIPVCVFILLGEGLLLLSYPQLQ